MGVFDAQAAGLFSTYHARIVFRDKVMGGTPKDPKIIASWLRTKTAITDEEELRQLLKRTLEETGADMPKDATGNLIADPTYEQLVAATETMANRQAVGFKRDDQHGLYIESRYIKAMLKEVVNIVFEGQAALELKWTDKKTTRKFALSYFAERVFVNPDRLYLGVKEPTGMELFVGHTTGKDGPQSNLTWYEYVLQPTIECDVMVLNNVVKEEHWPKLWVLAQENGLAALRSQGFGRFDIEEWRLLRPSQVPQAFEAALRAAVPI